MNVVPVNQEEFEVEEVIGTRVVSGGRREYQIKWAGYPLESSTWEAEELLQCPDKIKDFNSKQRSKRRGQNEARAVTTISKKPKAGKEESPPTELQSV